jgi:hypothetical protein
MMTSVYFLYKTHGPITVYRSVQRRELFSSTINIQINRPTKFVDTKH